MAVPTSEQLTPDESNRPVEAPLGYAPVSLAAMTEELYVHSVAAIRRRFFGKLLGHNALDDGGSGWAIFCEEGVGSTLAQGEQEVLFLSAMVPNKGMGGLLIPKMRIITNEEYRDGSIRGFLSQDITIRANGAANYLISMTEVDDDDHDKSFAAVMKSPATLFTVSDGMLVVTPNLKASTPFAPVDTSVPRETQLYPFGDSSSNIDDCFYALDQAKEILDTLTDAVPVYHQES